MAKYGDPGHLLCRIENGEGMGETRLRQKGQVQVASWEIRCTCENRSVIIPVNMQAWSCSFIWRHCAGKTDPANGLMALLPAPQARHGLPATAGPRPGSLSSATTSSGPPTSVGALLSVPRKSTIAQSISAAQPVISVHSIATGQREGDADVEGRGQHLINPAPPPPAGSAALPHPLAARELVSWRWRDPWGQVPGRTGC